MTDSSIDSREDLDFTAEELFAEIGKYFGLAPRLPGDVTLEQIAERFNIGLDTSRKKIYGLVKNGILKRVKVAGPNGHPIVVYRRGEKIDSA